ncbi:serine hydrolase domain-containing protein [Ferruginibacter sp. SUN002]|uniref:serine hydrolase domain-containing protein n=1 Tax=Ferruginibacter sp. SUN002 TaxID=2937789 RepID=UPI003D36DB51
MFYGIKSYFNQHTPLKGLTRALFLCLICIWLIFIYSSCNSTGSKNNNTDSIGILQLPKPTPVPEAESKRIYEAAKAWFDTVLLPCGFNGGMIIAKNNNIIFEQYHGTGHLPGNDTITANTPFHIASTSKTFTGMAVLKLWQDGKLHIDDAFSKYFPQFNYPGVTIRTLLNHRSGLPNYTHYMEEVLNWDKTKIITNQDVLNTLINNKEQLGPIVSPNTKFAYCNSNYALLALLIEKVTGKSYSDFVQNTFFIPLQMKNTFVFTMADTSKVIPSYDWKGLTPFNFLDAVYGDKNIYSTPRDLLIWDRALKSGQLLTEKTLNEAYAPYSNERPGVKNYGLGWRMNIYPNGKKIIFHNGWWHGSNSVFTRLLQDSATIIVIGNKFNRNIYHTSRLANLFGDYNQPLEEEENNVSKPSEKQDSMKHTDVLTNPLVPLKEATKKPLQKSATIAKKKSKK